MNIGNPNEISMLDLALVVRDLVGSNSDIVFVDRPVDDPCVRRPDITLARSSIGWEPQIDLRAGLERTITWFREELGVQSPLKRWLSEPPLHPETTPMQRDSGVSPRLIGLPTLEADASGGRSPE